MILPTLISDLLLRRKSLAVVLTAFAITFSPKACRSAEEVQILKQHAFNGLYTSYLCKSGIRIECEASKSYLVARAPEWRVVFFNPTNGKAMDMTYEEWIDHEPIWNPLAPPKGGLNIRRQNQQFEKTGRIDYMRKQCERYSVLNKSENGRINPFQRYWAEAYVLSDPKISKSELRIFEQFLELPNFDGLPVYATRLSQVQQAVNSGEVRSLMQLFSPRWQLTTNSFDEQAFDPKLFQYPAHFSKVGRECDVVVDKHTTEKGNAAFEFFK